MGILIGMVLSLLFPVVIIGGIIFLIVRSVSNRNGSGEPMEVDGEVVLKNIYTYLVLFATLMMTIGGSVGVFMGLADAVVPDPYVESYETYRNNYVPRDMYTPGVGAPEMQEGEEEQVREDYELMKKDAYDTARRRAFKLILQSTGWIVIPLPIFIYYQKQNEASKERREVR